MDKYRHKEDIFYLHLHGKSMHPALREGDSLCISKDSIPSLSIGDIVLYQNIFGAKLIHRIIKRYKYNGKREFVIMGDNWLLHADYVNEDKIMGKVIFAERNGKRIMINGTFSGRFVKYYFATVSLGKLFTVSILRKMKYLFIHIIISELLRRIEGMGSYRRYKERRLLKNEICFKRAAEADAGLLAKFYRFFYWPVSLETLTMQMQCEIKSSDDAASYFFVNDGNAIVSAAKARYVPQGNGILYGWIVSELYTDWRFHYMDIEKRLLDFIILQIKPVPTGIIRFIVSEKNIYACDYLSTFLGDSECVKLNNDLFRLFNLIKT